MKNILIALSIVLGVTALALAADEATSTEHRALNPAELKWAEPPPGIPAGAKMAVLHGNPGATGAFTVRLQAPAGYTIAPHKHPTTERVTVISGSFRVGMGEKFNDAGMQELGPGGYVVLPAQMAHYAKMASDGVIQIDSEGPFQINYINPSDDPRNKK